MAQIWAPHVIEKIELSELDLYIQFSSTACIPGGGCNVDEALQALYESNGDIKLAMQNLLAIQVNSQSIWTIDEVRTFERLVRLHGKDFHQISQDLTSKTVKECVLFYYLWKKRKPLSTLKHQYQEQINQISTSTDVVSKNQCPEDNPWNSSVNNPHQQRLLELPQQQQQPILETFPCRVCGRIFEKIKSRSAHMKRHKNER